MTVNSKRRRSGKSLATFARMPTLHGLRSWLKAFVLSLLHFLLISTAPQPSCIVFSKTRERKIHHTTSPEVLLAPRHLSPDTRQSDLPKTVPARGSQGSHRSSVNCGFTSHVWLPVNAASMFICSSGCWPILLEALHSLAQQLAFSIVATPSVRRISAIGIDVHHSVSTHTLPVGKHGNGTRRCGL